MYHLFILEKNKCDLFLLFTYCWTKEVLFACFFVCGKGQFENIRSWPVLGLFKFCNWNIFGKSAYSENGTLGSITVGSWTVVRDGLCLCPLCSMFLSYTCPVAWIFPCDVLKHVSEELAVEPSLFNCAYNYSWNCIR